MSIKKTFFFISIKSIESGSDNRYKKKDRDFHEISVKPDNGSWPKHFVT